MKHPKINMQEFYDLCKTVGPKMVPFLKAVTMYFVMIAFQAKGAVWTTLLKCGPIICLMFFILLYGFSLRKEHKYHQRILCGLICSCIGDALLNLNMFPHGMAAFAGAQFFYISAFGFRPLKLWIGFSLYLFGIMFVSLIFKSLDDIIAVGLPVYAFLLTTMCWRSLARATHQPNFLNIVCGIGSILFVISDGFIAIDRFHSFIPHAKLYIMTTYYAAQFAITLSVVNEKKSDKSVLNSKTNPNPNPNNNISSDLLRTPGGYDDGTQDKKSK